MASFPMRKNSTYLFVGLILIIFFFSSVRREDEGRQSVLSYFKNGKMMKSSNNDNDWQAIEQLQDFWKDLAMDLHGCRPQNDPPRHGPTPKGEREPLYSIQMTSKEIDQMRLSHKQFTTYTSTLTLEDLYVPESRGIVTTAGGKYIQILLVSLRMLRLTGSKLPVEVFLDDDSEYDEELCQKILPSLNAKCRVMSHILAKEGNTKIERYQFKVFSIIFSSFEDVIFLDADNLAARDPELLLSTKEFKETGMVLWPDFWPSSASPFFYQIQGNVKPGNSSIKTTESGQILVSKKKHARTLLLSAYYNFYGPKYYYPLLSRGAPGEGDKETFSVAAEYYGLPYHLIEHGVRAIGYFNSDQGGEFVGGCMMQMFPQKEQDGSHKPAFMHANFPKMNPSMIMDMPNTNWKDGVPHRMWQDLERHSSEFSWGGDPERAVFREMAFVACNYPRFVTNPDRVCNKIHKRLSQLFGDSIRPGRIDRGYRK